MAKTTLSERKASKLAELKKLKSEIATLEAKEAVRIGKIAVAAGLADCAISEAELKKEFEAIASRFSKTNKTEQKA